MTDPTTTPAPIQIHVFGRTDVGRTREHNEDSFVVADLSTNIASLQPSVRTHTSGPKGTLFMVADGMGGAAAGEIASQMATDIVLRELRDNWVPLKDPSPEAFARCLKRAAQSANQQIHSYATSHQEYRGMGTTATIAGFLDGVLYLCQVGDSRGYMVRDGVVRQLTKDQSLMQKLIEAGELTEEEAAQSERRNIILQALGPEATIKVDLTYQPVRKGDILLLCSDGLSGQITKDDIKRVTAEESDLVAQCKKLIDLANQAGGPDNITVIVAKFDGEGLEAPGDDDEVSHKVFAVAEGGSTPPMAMDRISEGPTLPMRPSSKADSARATLPVDQPPAAQDEEPAATAPRDEHGGYDTEAASQAETLDSIDTDALSKLSESRKGPGKVIAVILVILLVIAAAYYGMRYMAAARAPDSVAAADSSATADSTKPADSTTGAVDTTKPPTTSPTPPITP